MKTYRTERKSAYELACGQYEECLTGDVRAELYRDSLYHVRTFTAHTRREWKAYNTLADAQREYARQIREYHK